ncbi:ABC transporter ATP-binding protein [Mesomycoplasma conjunctivae]|uniref:ABC transporter ATP-binding protein n=1 Tax=Mesomycoplasma conjunctivae (strain ATCC 25834 / NCTC 10147 / HRC/581) TaxID=572263 RepID=C5J5J9_MESCH|nr:ATP-binding cassette domain-containing protein [Mesomycoplasma conjunctivae]CAT04722.1 ABC transporter ATP-binding protein [Mesomycoplasma conjunctivae]VEU65721.1 ABC transporter ATP-binding protein [Mesomycoplasma conjunctivae]
MNKLKFENVTFKYKQDDKPILKNINFEVTKDKPIFVIGPSGAGKSSFFLSIMQYMDILEGDIIYNGQIISKKNKAQTKEFVKKVGYLTQQPTSINFQTVFVNIAKELPKYQNKFFSFFSIPNKKQTQEIKDVLTKLGLQEKIFSIFSDLSGGQQQRVEVAKLMLQNPKIILADEPTTALDPKTSNQILDLIFRLAQINQSILFIITHDIEIIKKYDAKILLIKNKKAKLFKSFESINYQLLNEIFEED